jgi:putative membrane protein
VPGHSWRRTPAAAAAMVLMLVTGCKSRNSETAAGTSDTSMSSMSATDTSSMASSDTGRMASAGGGLSDANIVALLDEANMADSASGAYAVTKATSPDVKAFAKLMMGEHHALRAQGQQLAKRLNVTPEAPASDPLKPAAQSEMTALKGATKGAAFDRTYIEQEIGIHKAVLDLASKGHDAAQSPELKKLIEQAKPVIEKHLARAEEIQKKLGKPTA